MAVKLREAAARGNTQEVLRLLEEGAKIQPDDNGRTALHLAASSGHADVVAALLFAKCDVNVSDSSGCTALQRAAADGHLEVVQQLLKHGADVNRQDNVHGNTALHEASWKGYSHSVEALGKARANLHLKNCGGFAALHLCCQNGHNQSCRELLLAGCNPDLQNNYGDTPLHTSARYGHAGVTRILISAQCKASEQNKNGDTALHIAAAMGRRKLTRILLEAGCDKNLKNKQNETARDIATRKDLNEILVILSSSSSSKPKTNKSNDKKREKQESGTSSKDSSTRHKDKKKHKNGNKVHFAKEKEKESNGKQWSPYGCHYYPDPKAFPKPKLDSLPDDPLSKGEQYYLDLAGNICKGPVGVGYTCYCAPFFKHMEDRLDRDKNELIQHIDKAHERLDEKVSNLERRTHGQLSELTRTMAAERALCDRRHVHLAQWIERGTKGRSSERPRGVAELPPPIVARARSMEMLIDQPDAPRNKDGHREMNNRSLEILIDGPEEMWRKENQPEENWRKQKHRSSSHEMTRRQQESFDVAQELSSRFKQLPEDEHNRSFDALIDRSEWRGQPHRRSANELLTFIKNSENVNNESAPEHNRSFEAILRNRGMPWDNNKPHHKSANMIPVPSKRTMHHLNRSFDILVDKEADTFIPQVQELSEVNDLRQRIVNGSVSPARRGLNTVEENGEDGELPPEEWRGQPIRRSVQEMVARIQSAQAKKEEDWRARQHKEAIAEIEASNGVTPDGWAKDYHHAPWNNEHSHEEEISSESSGDEDQVEVESALVSELPYRSRTAVYSPDLHNDSGYSTKLYGSSQGPSPSLSGQLDCDGIQSLVNSNMCELPPRPPLPRMRTKDSGHIVTASLV